MDRIRESKRADLLFLEAAGGKHTTLNALYTEWPGGALYLFLGRQLVSPDPENVDGGLTDRAKELHCLYSVSAWVENSASVEEFFTELPQYIREGMQFPELTVVCSQYGGRRYEGKGCRILWPGCRARVPGSRILSPGCCARMPNSLAGLLYQDTEFSGGAAVPGSRIL